MNHSPTHVLLAVAITLPLVHAQSPTPVAPGNRAQPLAGPGTIVALHRPVRDGLADTRLWAATDSYKASFAHDVTFVPYLGSDYPTNQPLTWSTQAILVGSTELPLGPVEPVGTDRRYELRRPGVTEAYDVRTEGLEQTFVFPHRPAGRGDLVVRGAVATALHAEAQVDAHGAILFRDAAGTPIASYGAATAIDANGMRLPMTTAWANGTLTLRLPAADVERAAFPLVVDPLLAREFFGYTVTAITANDMDVTMKDGLDYDRLLTGSVNYASAVDADVRAYVHDWTPQLGIQLIFADVGTGYSSKHPRCAYVGGTNKWVVVYEDHDLTFGTVRVRVHQHDAANTTQLVSSVGLFNVAGTFDRRPDIGGSAPGSTGSHALIAFQREVTSGAFGETATSQVHATRFDTSTASGSFGVTQTLAATATTDNERPRVNEENEGGAYGGWICVFQQFNNTVAGDDWDVIGKRIEQDGTVEPGQWISDIVGRHQLHPVVAGARGRYAVAFASCEPSLGKLADTFGRDVRVERFDWAAFDGAPAAAGNQPVVTIHNNQSRIVEVGGISYDPFTQSHWTVGFREDGQNCYGARVGYRGQLTEGPTLGYALPPGTGTVITTYDRKYHRPCLAYAILDSGPPPYTAYIQPMPFVTPTPPATAGASCTSQSLQWSIFGAPNAPVELAQQIGNEFTMVSVTGTGNPGHLHLCVVSLATEDLPVPLAMVPAACRLLVSMGPQYLGMFPGVVGSNPSWRLSLPENLATTTVHFQDWIYDPYADTLRSTQRLTVPLVK